MHRGSKQNIIMSIYLIICTVFILLRDNEAARILVVIPAASFSHQLFFRPLTQVLAKRGHEVTVVTADPAFPKGQGPANFTEIDIHDVAYRVIDKNIVSNMGLGQSADHCNISKIMFEILSKAFEAAIRHPEVQDLMKNKKDYFDLLILEACVSSALALTHVFKAQVILISSFDTPMLNYDLLGVPKHYILYPTVNSQRIHNLTFWEKLRELKNHYSIDCFIKSETEVENQRFFGPDASTISESGDNVDMMFINIHPIWKGNNPLPPSVIHTWGVYSNAEKELQQDLISYLDSSVNGVIYMSLGSNVMPSMLPLKKLQTIIKVLSQLPYEVLLKWDKDELPGKPKNIKISKWFPQPTLLKHPKIKLFITQAGLQSTDETITAGVPVVCIPMFADQWFNAEKFVHLKIGVKLELEELSEETFRTAIDTVIGDKSYRDNIVKLRSLMADQPQPPLERAVWWTEHVLRHGGARHLRAPAANMSWREYLELDLVFTLLIGLLCFNAIFVSIIYYLCSNLLIVLTKLKRSNMS